MPGIVTLAIVVVAVIVAVSVIGFAAHFLFSPWLLLVAAAAALGWFKLRRRARR